MYSGIANRKCAYIKALGVWLDMLAFSTQTLQLCGNYTKNKPDIITTNSDTALFLRISFFSRWDSSLLSSINFNAKFALTLQIKSQYETWYFALRENQRVLLSINENKAGLDLRFSDPLMSANFLKASRFNISLTWFLEIDITIILKNDCPLWLKLNFVREVGLDSTW